MSRRASRSSGDPEVDLARLTRRGLASNAIFDKGRGALAIIAGAGACWLATSRFTWLEGALGYLGLAVPAGTSWASAHGWDLVHLAFRGFMTWCALLVPVSVMCNLAQDKYDSRYSEVVARRVLARAANRVDR